jgi:hypothetical protein
MPNAIDQLQRLSDAGFAPEQFDRYPNAIGIVRDECIALFQVTPDGLRMIGTPGWRMGEVMGVLVEREGRQVFQAKSELLDATPDRLEVLRRFHEDLQRSLMPLT